MAASAPRADEEPVAESATAMLLKAVGDGRTYAGNGDMALLEAALAAGADVNVVGAYGHSALLAACKNGFQDAALRLIQAGADPMFRKMPARRSVLHVACDKGMVDVVKHIVKLLPHQGDPSPAPPVSVAPSGGPQAAGTAHATPSSAAAMPHYGSPSEAGSDSVAGSGSAAGSPTVPEDGAGSAMAAASSPLAGSSHSLSTPHGVSGVDGPGGSGDSGVASAAGAAARAAGPPDVLRVDCDTDSDGEGADASSPGPLHINSPDYNGGTPLSYACDGCGSLETVRHLVEVGGALVHSSNKFGETPLHGACRQGNIHVVEYLVTRARANINAPSVTGETPLFHAARAQPLDVAARTMGVLITHGADIAATDVEGCTVLHRVARKALAPLVTLLLDSVADGIPTLSFLRCSSTDGHTPVAMASKVAAGSAGLSLEQQQTVDILLQREAEALRMVTG